MGNQLIHLNWLCAYLNPLNHTHAIVKVKLTVFLYSTVRFNVEFERVGGIWCLSYTPQAYKFGVWVYYTIPHSEKVLQQLKPLGLS